MIEEYWFMQEHEQLRAAATELYLNLLHSKEVSDSISFSDSCAKRGFSGARLRHATDNRSLETLGPVCWRR